MYRDGKLLYYKKEKAVPPKLVDGIPMKTKYKPPYRVWNNDMLIAEALLSHKVQSSWTQELQKEFTQLVIELKSTKIWVENEEGLPVEKIREESEYPDRYHQLNKIRKEAFGEFPIKINQNGGIAIKDDILRRELEEDQKVRELIDNN